MQPFPFAPKVHKYAIECDAGVRVFTFKVKAYTDVEILGPTGRTRAAGNAGEWVRVDRDEYRV